MFGTHYKKRQIAKQAANGGRECAENAAKHVVSCEAKVPCIMPCVWGEWGEWDGRCKTCFPDKEEKEHYCKNGEDIIRTRRKIVRGNDKKNCKRHDGSPGHYESKDKEEKDCKSCKTPVCKKQQCLWAEWSEWGDCEGKCGVNGQMTATRKCKYLEDTTDPDSVEEICCDSNEMCRSMKESAEKNGVTVTTVSTMNCEDLCQSLGWTEWSEWGQCSKTCGQGVMIRNRRCMGAGKDEIDSKESLASYTKWCKSESSPEGASLREKQQKDCDEGKCGGKHDCPHYDDICKKSPGYRRFRRQRRRRT